MLHPRTINRSTLPDFLNMFLIIFRVASQRVAVGKIDASPGFAVTSKAATVRAPARTGEKSMPKFVLAYHGSKRPENPAQHMTRWTAWVEGLGAAFVNPGVPLGKSKTVSADGVTDGGGPNPLAGFSIIEASNMEAAVAMVRACPHLDIGTIEIAEAMDMDMRGKR